MTLASLLMSSAVPHVVSSPTFENQNSIQNSPSGEAVCGAMPADRLSAFSPAGKTGSTESIKGPSSRPLSLTQEPWAHTQQQQHNLKKGWIGLRAKTQNNEASRLTCCSSSERSWLSPSCAGWGSPPWPQPTRRLSPEVHLSLSFRQSVWTTELLMAVGSLLSRPVGVASARLCWCYMV